MATLGFIGTGNMGGALAKAACGVLPSDQVFLSNRTLSKAQLLAEELECRVTDNEAIAGSADLIFLGVKPQMMAEMLEDIAPVLKKRERRFLLISMAAARKPRCSSVRTPAIVVPAGLQTSAWSLPGCLPEVRAVPAAPMSVCAARASA